jgi:xanthine dehydrogenase YagR molybdenum-binding subunit
MGQPLDRVDGLLKGTGQARYAAEFPEAGLLHGSVVSSSIASGRVVSIDASRALALPGVIAVIDHTNRPKIASYDDDYEDADSAEGSPFRPIYNDRVLYSGQPLALVVADNLELARHAGSLIKIEYATDSHQTDLLSLQHEAHPAPAELPKPRGNFEAEFAGAAMSLDLNYSTPIEHHNPMEPHASTVLYQADGSLHIHDKNQGPQNCQSYVQKVFGLEKDQV